MTSAGRRFTRASRERAQRILADAQARAERIREEAQARAEGILADAQAAGGRVRAEAQAQADRVRADAQARADRLLADARETAERLRAEAPRKAVHLASIGIPIAILHLPLTTCRWSLLGASVALLVVDLVKMHSPRLRSYFAQFFGRLLRHHEHTDVTGSTYLVLSALLVTLLFDREVAAAALVYLIVGDTLAAMVGKAWGRTPLFGKSLEGFLAGLVASLAAAWALVPGLGLGPLAAGALVAAVVEVLPLPVDDNFRIPLVAGLVLQWLR